MADENQDWAPDSPLKILVVDDEVENVRLFQRALRRDFTVLPALSGAEALDILERNRDVFLILTDQRMPGMTGSEFLAKAVELAPQAIRVMVTGHADFDAVADAVNLGKIWSLVRKPASRTDLSAVVNASLELYRVQEENHSLLSRLAKAHRDLADTSQLLELESGDQTRRLRSENRKLASLSARDTVTGLYNHRHLREVLERELARAQRYGTALSLLLLDVDGFLEVTREHGLDRGDDLLKWIAGLLTGKGTLRGLRKSDVAARCGADRLAVVLTQTPKLGALKAAERIRRDIELGDPSGQVVRATVSVGVTQFPVDGSTEAELLDCAQQAATRAKREGGNRTVGYAPQLLARTTQHSVACGQLRAAEALEKVIAGGTFDLALQPIVELETGSEHGREVLCRPRSSVLPSPAELFRLAETMGAMASLGRTIRRRIVDDVAHRFASLIFVNIHPHEINGAEFLESAKVLRDALGERVVLEITESTEVVELELARETVKILREMGLKIAVDDFGAGRSGINRVALIQPDYIKLDMLLVRGLGQGSRSSGLVRYVLDFARSEGIHVVAEGIETEEELERVVNLGCQLGQGYRLGRPKLVARTSE